jgi:hypothetical protein
MTFLRCVRVVVCGRCCSGSSQSTPQVPYVDDNGGSGIALACGECSDEDAQVLWGPDNWYSQKAIGRCFYIHPPHTSMPMRPERYSLAGDVEGPAYPSDSWMPLTNERHVKDKASGKYLLPIRPWVYPAPGYLQSIYRAHALVGLADSLLVLHTHRTSRRRPPPPPPLPPVELRNSHLFAGYIPAHGSVNRTAKLLECQSRFERLCHGPRPLFSFQSPTLTTNGFSPVPFLYTEQTSACAG